MVCRGCGEDKPKDMMSKPRLSRCKACVTAYAREYRERNPGQHLATVKRWQERNPHYMRDRHLRRTFGITAVQFDEIVAQQDGLCPICHTSLDDTGSVDHCHNSGEIRGVLHRKCNSALGILKDDPVILLRAAEYLMRSEGVSRPLEEMFG